MNWLKKFFVWGVLPVVTVLVILVLFGQQWAFSYLAPPDTFELSDAPTAPNYQDEYYWVAHPNKSDTSDLIPQGLSLEDDLVDKSVDVFFIHSTGYFGPGKWNSTMSFENSEAQSIEYMLSSMASIFNGCCKVYAPHYREAHIISFVPEHFDNGTQALDLAYTDVAAAFEYYLQNSNNGRPFIIVGHSQGTAHALRLLESRVDKTNLYEQLVAAYVLGYWLPQDKFSRGFERISPCTSATQTGCIISYDVYGQGGTLDANVPHWYTTGWEASQVADGSSKPIVCTNPLNWSDSQERVDKNAHLGAMPVEFKRTPLYMLLAKNPGFVYEQLPPLTEQLTWAQCQQDGRLEIAEQVDNAFSNHLAQANNSYHVFDFSLFYGNLRQNAIQRVSQFEKVKNNP